MVNLPKKCCVAGTQRQELNGKTGTALQYDTDKDRFVVKMDDGNTISLKPDNIQLIEEDGADLISPWVAPPRSGLPLGRQECRDFTKGMCSYGADCKFHHRPPEISPYKPVAGKFRLHASGLDHNTTEDQLMARFKQFGTIETVTIPRDSSGCKGFGFVTIRTTDVKLEECLKVYRGTKWRGRLFKVSLAKPDYISLIQQAAKSEEMENSQRMEQVAATPRLRNKSGQRRNDAVVYRFPTGRRDANSGELQRVVVREKPSIKKFPVSVTCTAPLSLTELHKLWTSPDLYKQQSSQAATGLPVEDHSVQQEDCGNEDPLWQGEGTGNAFEKLEPSTSCDSGEISVSLAESSGATDVVCFSSDEEHFGGGHKQKFRALGWSSDDSDSDIRSDKPTPENSRGLATEVEEDQYVQTESCNDAHDFVAAARAYFETVADSRQECVSESLGCSERARMQKLAQESFDKPGQGNSSHANSDEYTSKETLSDEQLKEKIEAALLASDTEDSEQESGEDAEKEGEEEGEEDQEESEQDQVDFEEDQDEFEEDQDDPEEFDGTPDGKPRGNVGNRPTSSDISNNSDEEATDAGEEEPNIEEEEEEGDDENDETEEEEGGHEAADGMILNFGGGFQFNWTTLKRSKKQQISKAGGRVSGAADSAALSKKQRRQAIEQRKRELREKRQREKQEKRSKQRVQRTSIPQFDGGADIEDVGVGSCTTDDSDNNVLFLVPDKKILFIPQLDGAGNVAKGTPRARSNISRLKTTKEMADAATARRISAMARREEELKRSRAAVEAAKSSKKSVKISLLDDDNLEAILLRSAAAKTEQRTSNTEPVHTHDNAPSSSIAPPASPSNAFSFGAGGQTSGQPKPITDWLGSSSEDEEGDEISWGSSKLTVRSAFAGSKGRKNMALQASYGGDDRFKLDNRFAEESDSDSSSDSGDGDGKTGQASKSGISSKANGEGSVNIQSEKYAALSVLEDVVGGAPLLSEQQHLEQRRARRHQKRAAVSDSESSGSSDSSDTTNNKRRQKEKSQGLGASAAPLSFAAAAAEAAAGGLDVSQHWRKQKRFDPTKPTPDLLQPVAKSRHKKKTAEQEDANKAQDVIGKDKKAGTESNEVEEQLKPGLKPIPKISSNFAFQANTYLRGLFEDPPPSGAFTFFDNQQQKQDLEPPSAAGFTFAFGGDQENKEVSDSNDERDASEESDHGATEAINFSKVTKNASFTSTSQGQTFNKAVDSEAVVPKNKSILHQPRFSYDSLSHKSKAKASSKKQPDMEPPAAAKNTKVTPFMRLQPLEEIEETWKAKRSSITYDFRRKHKSAQKRKQQLTVGRGIVQRKKKKPRKD